MLIDFIVKIIENWNNLLRLTVITNMQKKICISILPEVMLQNAHFLHRVDNYAKFLTYFNP